MTSNKKTFLKLFLLTAVFGVSVGVGKPLYAYASCPNDECYVSASPAEPTDCTKANPCTLQAAHDMADAGDTIYVRGGTYNGYGGPYTQDGRYITWTKSGTASDWIRVVNYANETPLFTTPLINSTCYNKCGFLGFFVYFPYQSAVHHVLFDGFEISNFKGAAFSLNDTDNVTIKNMYMHDMWIGQSGMIHTNNSAPDKYVTNTIIEGNRFENVGKNCNIDGIHAIYPGDNGRGLIIRNNYIEQTLNAESGSGDPTIKQGSYYPYGSKNVYIYNNIFDGSKSSRSIDTDKRQIWIGSGPNFNHYVFNNTFYTVGNNPADTICAEIRFTTTNGVMIKNNIFYKGGAHCLGDNIIYEYGASTNKDVDFNAYYPQRDTVDDPGANSFISTNINFVSISGLDFHLQSTSGAINKGIDLSEINFDWGFATTSPNAPTSTFNVTTDYDGEIRPTGAWDIGADEYQSTDTTPPAIPQGVSVQ